MIRHSCKESGLECDYIAEGKTEDEVFKHISEHAVNVHNMRAQDLYEGKCVSHALMPSHR